jgi:hypothetical protein
MKDRIGSEPAKPLADSKKLGSQFLLDATFHKTGDETAIH